MKRPVLLLIAAALILLSGLPAAAQTPADLGVLARFFPADTALFIGFRTDDDFVATLNNLAERVTDLVFNAVMDQSLQEALDELVQSIYPGGSFQENVRPWLGDVAAVGFLSLEQQIASGTALDGDETPVLVAASIKDRAAALDFVVNLLNQEGVPFFQTTGEDYTLLVVDQQQMPATLDGAQVVIVRDDVLLLSANTDTNLYTPGSLPDPNLLNGSDFSAALDWLPAAAYNVTVYYDTVSVLLSAMSGDDPETELALSLIERMGLSAASPQMIGFTVLDDVTLTIDTAQRFDPSASPLMIAMPGPVDPAFAARVPADIPLVIHITDLKLQLEGASSSINALLEIFAAGPDVDEGDLEAARMELSKQFAQVNNLFTSFTKLDFVQDVLSWLDGDAVAFIGFNPELDATTLLGLTMVFPLELGIGIETTDTAKAQATFDGLTLGLKQLVKMANASSSPSGSDPQLTVTTDALAGTPVTVLTLTSRDLPWPIELLMGTNDRVFAIGTRGAVAAMFSADGGLTSNAAFRAAQAYMLPNANSVAWLNPAGLLPLADLFQAALGSGPSAESDAQAMRSMLNLVRGGTITSAYDQANNLALVRMTLTLNAQ